MKKTIYTFLLMISISVAFADEKEVIIENIKDTQPRSATQKPTVFVDDVQNTLSVKFTTQGEVYAITITDSAGNPVTQLQTISDVNMQVFFTPTMANGAYSIAIKGESQSFIGEFTIF